MSRLTLAAGVVAGALAVAAARPALAQDAPARDSAASATSLAAVRVTEKKWASNRFLRADEQRRRVLALMDENRALERQLRDHDRTIAHLERRLARARTVRDSLDRTAAPVSADGGAGDARAEVRADAPRAEAPRVGARAQRPKGESR